MFQPRLSLWKRGGQAALFSQTVLPVPLRGSFSGMIDSHRIEARLTCNVSAPSAMRAHLRRVVPTNQKPEKITVCTNTTLRCTAAGLPEQPHAGTRTRLGRPLSLRAALRRRRNGEHYGTLYLAGEPLLSLSCGLLFWSHAKPGASSLTSNTAQRTTGGSKECWDGHSAAPELLSV